MKQTLGFATLLLVIGVLVGAYVIPTSTPPVATPPSGGSAGPLHTEYQEFEGGVQYGNTLTVSTSTTAGIIPASEFRQWLKADTVVVTLTGAASNRTITFPASSTLADALPRAGDMTKTCIHNATTGPAIVLAGGTGVNLNVSSSSASTLGSTLIGANEIGCITFIRGGATATTFDIEALFESFK